jgi:hypothetical protein
MMFLGLLAFFAFMLYLFVLERHNISNRLENLIPLAIQTQTAQKMYWSQEPCYDHCNGKPTAVTKEFVCEAAANPIAWHQHDGSMYAWFPHAHSWDGARAGCQMISPDADLVSLNSSVSKQRFRF